MLFGKETDHAIGSWVWAAHIFILLISECFPNLNVRWRRPECFQQSNSLPTLSSSSQGTSGPTPEQL